MKILVTGGLGYIGSQMAATLLAAGHTVVVFDRAPRHPLQSVPENIVVRGDLADAAALDALFAAHRFDAVMHFAGSIQVGESVCLPGRYYANNVGATLILLDTMLRYGCLKLVFSSSAAVYGEPQHVPIDENHPIAPLSPYGASKAMAERMLADFFTAHGMSSVSLRYFNAAGAAPDGSGGECHVPETHLIPLALQAASGRLASIGVYGTDFDTPDGTAIRDYVHVHDLCDAHLLALEFLSDQPGAHAFNLGIGEGYSVRQIIDVVRLVTGRQIRTQALPRRPGDSARLVAASDRARQILGWAPHHEDIAVIITHAWSWEGKLCRFSQDVPA
jgi:UDP-glucose 4-epimerase